MIADVMAKAGRTLDSGADDPGVIEAVWRHLDDLGLVRLTGDPEAGGSGAGWPEAVVLLEAAAAHDIRLPLAEHDLLAGWLVERSDLETRPGPTGFAFVGSDDIAHLSVPSPILRQIVVVGKKADGSVRAGYVDAVDIESKIRRSSPLGTVDLHIAPDAVDWVAIPAELAAELHLRGALARSAQMVGAIGRVVDSAVAHTNERKQFGKPLAKFQAVRALLASTAAEAALASTAVAAAVEAVRSGDLRDGNAAGRAVAGAKSSAGRASEIAVRQGHQAHGAIGTTFEHDLHRYTTALLAWRRDFGSASFWDEQLARQARARTQGTLWAHVTGVGNAI
ncbi:acyl-CoA dehydrogenase family protein [Rhodococcus artemisiae]